MSLQNYRGIENLPRKIDRFFVLLYISLPITLVKLGCYVKHVFFCNGHFVITLYFINNCGKPKSSHCGLRQD